MVEPASTCYGCAYSTRRELEHYEAIDPPHNTFTKCTEEPSITHKFGTKDEAELDIGKAG